MTNVTTYYLEMLDPQALRPKPSRDGTALVRVDPPMPELNRFFYATVGGDWHWIDRLPWTWKQWFDYLNRPELHTWMLTVHGIPAGYFELEAQPGGHVEIAYFGLLPSFVSKGLGGYLLTCAIEKAWAMNARRVWVHTCSLDHPQALQNYLARGFTKYKEEITSIEVASQPIGPWPGSRD